MADERNRSNRESPRIGAHWEGRLEEWLEAVLVPRGTTPPENIQDWSFPTDCLKSEYINSIQSRNEEDVYSLLKLFLFENCHFGPDREILRSLLADDREGLAAPPPEYSWRLQNMVRKGVYPHPGVRWAIDLLPHNTESAISVIRAYLEAYFGLLPDGRIDGLFDALSIIRARWITPSEDDMERLYVLSPRDLERLVAALYENLGYEVSLTPPSRDGGRDVEASKLQPGRSDHILVECKAHTEPIGVAVARALLGVVSNEHANRGILVTTSRFTRGVVRLASEDRRLELIDGRALTTLLNSRFGPTWHQTFDRITHSFK